MATQRAPAAAAAVAKKRATAPTTKKKIKRRVKPKRPADHARARVETFAPVDVHEVIEAPSHPLATST